MATLATAVGSTAASTRAATARAEAIVFPWLLLVASAWLVGGIYLDGWAHNHGKVDSFFTFWHAVLYSGYAASAAVLFASLRPRARRGPLWARLRIPRGYGLALAGAVLFGAAGLLDMVWHLVFGIEVNVSALLSPSHLMLATGATLIALGPLRAAWPADRSPTWTGWVAVLASATLGYAVLAFMTQFAQPLVWPEASADFSRIIEGSDVYVMDADGSRQTRLTRVEGTSAGQPTWSADGRLAYSSNRPNEHGGGLVLANADGTAAQALTHNRDGQFAAHPVWSPDGKSIAFIGVAAGRGAQVYLLDPSTGAQRQLTSTGVLPWSSVSWSPDSQRLAFTAERGTDVWVHVIGVEGGEPTPLVEGFSPAWSPDGARLAFGSERTGALEVFSARVDGSDVRQLTTTTSQVRRHTGSWSPVWSPDGQRIAFASSRDGSLDVFVMDAHGQHQVNLTQNRALDSVDPAWLPDGRLGYTGRVRDRDLTTGEALGVAGVLIQAALLAGLVLVLTARWRLPFGACTAVFGLSAVLLSSQNDTFQFIPSAVVAGLVADLLLRRVRTLPVIASAVPAVYFASYFAALAISDGIGWPVHLWAGAIVLAGVVGLLLSLLVSPARPAESAA